MAAIKGTTFATNVSAAGTYGPFQWAGGRAVLVACATTFPTSLQLQIVLQNGSAFNMGTAMTANGVSASLDLPAGQYQVVATGTTAGLYATITSVPYL